MATATKPKTANPADAAAESLRKTSATILDAYESTLNSVADYQDKVAEQAQVEWVATVARTQAELTRGVTKVYVSTARGLIK